MVSRLTIVLLFPSNDGAAEDENITLFLLVIVLLLDGWNGRANAA